MMARRFGASATPIDPEKAAQAKEAVRVFRSMIPMLNAYAQNLTGNPKVRVKISQHSNGSTNGKDIFYRPPLALGLRRTHEKWRCHERGEDKILLCPACAQHEQVLVPIYHEIAHIWFDSFGKVSDKTRKEAIEASLASPHADNAFGRGIRRRCEAAPIRANDYMGLSGLISPWMQLLLNSLEDARIENALFRALPGTKVMFEADIVRSLASGVEGVDPITGQHSVVHWRDRELNHQVIVALYFKAVGYDYSGWFNDWVVKTLDDPELDELLDGVRKATRIDGVFVSAFPILALLHEKWGYFKSDDDPEPDVPDESDDADPESEDSDVSAEADPGPSSDVSDSDENNSTDSAEGESGDEAGEDSEGGSERDSSSSGGDSEASDVGSGSDSAGDSEGDESPSTEEGEVADEDGEGSSDPDGGSSAGSSSSGHSDDIETPGDGPLDDDDSPGDPEAESDGPDGAGSDVPEDVPADGTAGRGDAEDAGDPDADRDGEDADRGLDGLPPEVSGERSDGEPGGDSGDLPDDSAEDDDAELIDPGPWDDESSGTSDMPSRPNIDWGTAEQVEVMIAEATGHERPDEDEYSPDAFDDDDDEEDRVMQVVIVQGEWFDQPAVGIVGVEMLKQGDSKYRGGGGVIASRGRRSTGAAGDFTPPENVISKTLLEARVAFAANERGTHERGLKRGRVHASSLGRRAPFNDPKMFEKKTLPGRKSYFVGLGLDISGSTVGVNIDLIKRVAFAEAELLNRLGIPFFMYAHTGDESSFGSDDWKVQLHEIRSPDEPWNDTTRNRLAGLSAFSANLDGHTLEQYRKMLDRRRETVKIMHYYTDGAMPCENYEEELSVLTREIRTFKQRRYELVGIGVRTDAPKAHGLETVEVNAVEDVALVVADLRKRLLRR